LFYRFKKLRKMKKLVFMFVAVAAISFASCGNKTAQGETVDTDSIAEVVDSADTAAVDSAATDSVK
jgi:predicted small secreted protein